MYILPLDPESPSSVQQNSVRLPCLSPLLHPPTSLLRACIFQILQSLGYYCLFAAVPKVSTDPARPYHLLSRAHPAAGHSLLQPCFGGMRASIQLHSFSNSISGLAVLTQLKPLPANSARPTPPPHAGAANYTLSGSGENLDMHLRPHSPDCHANPLNFLFLTRRLFLRYY